MAVSESKKQEETKNELQSLRGTLFSIIVFVGGGISLFIVTLFYFYMTRI